MFRNIVLLTCCALFSEVGFAQRLEEAAVSPRLNDHQSSATRSSGRFAVTKENRVSIARLREPRKAQQLFEKAMQEWVRQKPAEALHKLDQALQIYPTFPEALTLYGGIQTSLQQWRSAEQHVQAAIDCDPGYGPAYVVLAATYNAQTRFDDAQKAAEQALLAGANTWDVHYEIARAMIGKRQYETALAVADAALQSEVHGSLLHLAKAHALLGLRNYRQAVTELRTYVYDQPDGDGSDNARRLLNQLQTALPE